MYANINRATNKRDTNGRRPVASFQKMRNRRLKRDLLRLKLALSMRSGHLISFRRMKYRRISAHAINIIEGVRRTVGNNIDILIDVHSHLNVPLSIDTAKRLEAAKLYWFEEPVDPDKYHKETKTIRNSINCRY